MASEDRGGKDGIAVEVKGVSKSFRLYHDVNYNLKEKIINWRKRGYDLFWALNDVTFDVRHGETLAIIGPNGSGKSTLLRMMTRILKPDKGEIAMHGKVAALLDLGAGFHPDLTGRENTYLNASILGFKKKEVDAIFDEIVEFSELEAFLDNQVKNYSSGMYVRLGFSVAINVDPDILLIDEVLAVGDEAFQAKCLERIRRLQEEGTTIILVTHTTDTAAQLSDRILWLESGRIRMLGDPWEVAGEYHKAMSLRPVGEEAGTRELEMTEVLLLDGEGRPCVEFETGKPMSIRMSFLAHEPVENPVFSIAVYNSQGLLVYGTGTQRRGVGLGTVEGEGCLAFNIPSLMLLDGRYFLTVNAMSSDGLVNYHFLDKKYQFDVKSHGEDEGYLGMDCEIVRLRRGGSG